MPLKDEKLRATAIHEAGHAVAICRLGGEIDRVTLDGRAAGVGQWPAGKVGAIVCFAGSAAEARYRNLPFDEALSGAGLLDEIQFHGHVRKNRSKRWQADREKDACTFVDENWRAIERVAAALLEHRELDHDAVMALIDGRTDAAS